MTPTISICIPTYNAERHLKRSIDSALALNYRDVEIVVGNDGSDDGTEDLLSEYADPRLETYTNGENLGFDRNILRMVEHANGEYLFFISDEDLIMGSGFPRVHDTVSNTRGLSVLFGDIFDLREGKDRLYYDLEEYYWPESEGALRALARIQGNTFGWWAHSYMGGTVIARHAVDTSFAREYVGCGYMVSLLVVDALTKGGMYWLGTPIIAVWPETADRGRHPVTQTDVKALVADDLEARLSQQQYRLLAADELDLDEETMRIVVEQEKTFLLRMMLRKHGLNLPRMVSDIRSRSLHLSIRDVLRIGMDASMDRIV